VGVAVVREAQLESCVSGGSLDFVKGERVKIEGHAGMWMWGLKIAH
jgi:hypothetical protein